MTHSRVIAAAAASLCVACSTGADPEPPVPGGSYTPDTKRAPDALPWVPDTGRRPVFDAVVDTGGVRALADLGDPCVANGDCLSEFCVPGPKGSVCSQQCVTECPVGWACRGVNTGGSDLFFLCVPIGEELCTACTVDLQCQGGLCAAVGGTGACTIQCSDSAPCPGGYACVALDRVEGGNPFMGCLPHNGTCSCDEGSAGLQRSCSASNEHGSCAGFETCDTEEGWLDCDAPPPAPETCNGADDDCDGLVDEELIEDAAEPCVHEVEGVGACEGQSVCTGATGWVCQAPIPTGENCDGFDNDCDGAVDEDFVVGTVYAHDEHCGGCGQSCASAILNGIGACEVDADGVPKCVVQECAPGFTKVNDFQCVPQFQSVCQPCDSDAQCLGGGQCVSLDDGTYCTKPCAQSDDCPGGYDCSIGQCVPTTNSCTCDGSNLALQRECKLFAGGTGGAPLYTCPGYQDCTPGGWGACQVAQDVCDGLDNDCDGAIDEGFLVDGVYASDAHCGKCKNNCVAMQFVNGKGFCDASGPAPICGFTCVPGTADVNDNPKDGCECVVTSEIDLPGGADTNCDGVDGEDDNAVYVSKNGHDANPGTADAPLLTISAGIAESAAADKRDVYVATGVYVESIALQPGVAIYGGYSADFAERDPVSYQTAILGGSPTAGFWGAINGDGITGLAAGATRVDGLDVFAADNPNPGGSSYGIWLRNCDQSVAVSDVRVVAGDGGHGTDGAPGVHGEPGQPGAPGAAAQDIAGPVCGATHWALGGEGGDGLCGALATSGGAGGTAICPDFDDTGAQPKSDPITQSSSVVEKGGKGLGGGGGGGGAAGFDSSLNFEPTQCTICNPYTSQSGASSTGAAGKHGSAGAPGEGGATCWDPAGQVSASGLWQGTTSAGGVPGLPGGGGGGGGAGGGVESVDCHTKPALWSDVGGSGGGGGAGGCSGGGGGAGTPGGGSFAVFVSWSAPPATVPQLATLTLTRGHGGKGGHGGSAGVGGGGGSGGNGGAGGKLPAASNPDWCAAAGGVGGDGGSGGHGGGGGGGCGGPSYGLYTAGAPEDALIAAGYTAAVTVLPGGGQGGAGGPGGSSVGAPGAGGTNGPTAAFGLF